MRDPYEILGVKRGATAKEARAAYVRASKKCHPDLGGSHEKMVELNAAYEFVLNEIKSAQGARAGAGQREQSAGGATGGTERPREETHARADEEYADAFDIDEELENLRRASESLDERLRGRRQQAWNSGEHVVWAKLTWEDLARFFGGLLRGGVKGLATLFAALIGVGTILVQANFISTLVILGSSIGFLVSLALKSDKGGFMSAGLVLFGVATIWMPAVRGALFGWPLATISVLVCLALIFKFTREGGMAGLMTGGVLGLFLITAILDDPQRDRQITANTPTRTATLPVAPRRELPQPQASRPEPVAPAPAPFPPGPRPQPFQVVRPPPQPPTPPSPLEPRELLAAQGSLLKFAEGVPYQLKVRSGLKTKIVAASGAVAFYRGDSRDGDCVMVLEFAAPAAATPYQNVDRLVRACNGDAVFQVSEVQRINRVR